MLELIKLSLGQNANTDLVVNQNDYDEMEKHVLTALPAPILSKLSLSQELYEKWKNAVLQQVVNYYNYKYVQDQLPVQVPYVVLKGTSAAQYYPYPEYRIMGDIDIMTKREDFLRACKMLQDNNWTEMTSTHDMKRGRHRAYTKDGFVVEVHAFFASMNDPEKAQYLDDLIIENIKDSHILPDLINGLVLIDHVNQHMEEGLGLRQIIDWMMFVDKCLPDEKWLEFEKIANKTGLDTLAIITTRMCEIYLGLSEHKWCAKADEHLCHKLMKYIMECGNFGVKRNKNEKLAISRTGRLRHPQKLLGDLQKKGVENWKAARNPLLRCFAWAWQGIQFLKETPQFMKGYLLSKERNRLFNKLGVKRDEDGLVYYIDGQYVKK